MDLTTNDLKVLYRASVHRLQDLKDLIREEKISEDDSEYKLLKKIVLKIGQEI